MTLIQAIDPQALKILQLCNKIPYPPKDGGAFAVYNLTKGFHELGAEVTLLAMNTSRHYVPPDHQFPKELTALATMEIADVDNRIKPFHALLNLFTGRSYNVERFISASFAAKLKAILTQDRFDVIQLEGLYLTPYIPAIRKLSDAPIAYRAHNIEYQIWERLTAGASGLKKWYLKLLTTRLRHYETEVLASCDAIIPITENDGAVLAGYQPELPVHVTPFGIEPFPESGIPVEFPSLFFIGSLDWMPNEEGLTWFLNEVWPALHRKYPDLKFYMAGRHMPEWIRQLRSDNLVPVGEVDDAPDFIRSKAIMIVPLFSGSGMRVKIIEGMALGKTIVATPVAVEGIACENGKHLMIADRPETFMAAIERCLEDPALVEQITKEARSLVENRYDYRTISRSLLDFYETLIS